MLMQLPVETGQIVERLPDPGRGDRLAKVVLRAVDRRQPGGEWINPLPRCLLLALLTIFYLFHAES
jgi:hypothetical protein